MHSPVVSCQWVFMCVHVAASLKHEAISDRCPVCQIQGKISAFPHSFSFLYSVLLPASTVVFIVTFAAPFSQDRTCENTGNNGLLDSSSPCTFVQEQVGCLGQWPWLC